MCSWCESIDYVVNGNVQCPITGDKRRLFRNAEVTSTPTNTSVQEPNTLFFARNDTSTSLRSIHIIIDPSQPVLEPNLSFSGDVFDGCFGIPRSPHPSKKLISQLKINEIALIKQT